MWKYNYHYHNLKIIMIYLIIFKASSKQLHIKHIKEINTPKALQFSSS